MTDNHYMYDVAYRSDSATTGRLLGLVFALMLAALLCGCTGEELAGLPPGSAGERVKPEFRQDLFKPRYARIEEYHRLALQLAPLQRDMPPVSPGDWRSFWKEPEQTPQQYVASFPVTANKLRSTLYVCRVGAMTGEDAEIFRRTVAYLAACFQCPVREAPEIALALFPANAQRRVGRGEIAVNSVYLTDNLLKPRLPEDGWGIFALTAHDIYKADGLSMQYGDSLVFGRAAVLSLYHLRARDNQQLTLLRVLKGASHETAHMLSIPHCQHYLCNMNGRSGLPEFDRAPLHFCPDCLAKLLYATGADPLARFVALEGQARECGLRAEEAYSRRAAEIIRAGARSDAQQPSQENP